MKILICLLLGYLLGTFNPAAMFAKAKKIDLRHEGTGNLGATNTLIVMGKGYGVLVMLLDVGKAYLACKLARRLFPHMATAGLLAGLAAVVGHIFPFYMKFKGGKGLAAYGGMILAHNPKMFLFLFVTAVILMLIVNYSIAAHLYASVAFPVLVGIQTRSLAPTLVCIATGALIATKNWFIIDRIRRGEDKKVRDFLCGR